MSDDTMEVSGSRVTQKQLYDAIQDLRKETKEDLKDMKEELLKAITDALGEFRHYTDHHSETHRELERGGTQALAAHINEESRTEAQEEGRREVVFGTIKFLNENWKVVLIAAALLLGLLGKVDISAFLN